MRQAALRGNWEVQVQALMAFAAYNIKRLVKGATPVVKSAQTAVPTGVCSLVESVHRFFRSGYSEGPAFC